MKKRFLSLLLVISVLSALITAMPITASAATSGTCGDNLTWTFDDAGTLTISGSGDMWNYTSSSAPWYNRLSEIKNVVIENGVTGIGKYAFYDCDVLTDVIIPDSVTSIGDFAFYSCNDLGDITIGNSVTSIGYATFCNCTGLSSVTIPKSVSSIDSYAFAYCYDLENLYIYDLVAWSNINFNGVYSNPINDIKNLYLDGKLLTSITIPNDITDINYVALCNYSGLGAIYVDEKHTKFSSIDGVLFNKEQTELLVYPQGKNGIYTLPDSVTSIENGAFNNCNDLSGVRYNGSFEDFIKISVGANNEEFNNATLYCAGTEIKGHGTCGDNLTWILYGNGNLSISGTGEMQYNDNSWLPFAPWYNIRESITSVEIDSGVTSIMRGAFYECRNLTSITIPAGITNIGDDYLVFEGCTSLAEINVDENNDNYSSLNGVLFNKDRSELIKYPEGKSGDYVIPASVTSIGSRSFFGCFGVTSITLPESVVKIGDRAFYECGSLKEVHYNGSFENFKKISVGEYNECYNKAAIYCTDITIMGYGTCGDNLTWILYDDGKLVISGTGDMTNYSNSPYPYYSPFSNNSNIKSVILENGITSIGDEAFSGCGGLISVTIPNSVTSIGDEAFSGCDRLTSIMIPAGVTEIGNSAFNGCDNLESIAVAEDNPNYVAENNVLFNKEKTELIKIAEKSIIGAYTVPDGVTRIGNLAFSNCYTLTSITIPNSVTSIGDFAFSYCYNLTSITIPNSITSIGDFAFSYCYNLTSITIPNSVTSIGDFAFDHSLKEVHYNGSFENFRKTYPSGYVHTMIYCTDRTVEGYGVCGGTVFNPEDNLIWVRENGTLTIDGIGTMFDNYYPNYVGAESPWQRSDIENIIIKNGVTNIGRYAFFDCKDLSSVTIPATVTKIGNYAFDKCNSLTDVYYNGLKEQWNEITINKGNDYLTNATIHCSDGIITPLPLPMITAGITRIDTDVEAMYKFVVMPKETLDEIYTRCKVYAAVYDKNGRLLGINSVRLNTYGQTEISVSKSNNGAFAKIFIFQDNLQPILRNVEKISLQ